MNPPDNLVQQAATEFFALLVRLRAEIAHVAPRALRYALASRLVRRACMAAQARREGAEVTLYDAPGPAWVAIALHEFLEQRRDEIVENLANDTLHNLGVSHE